MSSEERIRFDGQVALVTGAGHGLGRAHAEALAARGAAVLVNNRRREDEPGPGSAERVALGIRERGGQAFANEESVEADGAGERLVQAALERFGRLDILICNAGSGQSRMFHRQSFDEIRRLIDVNLIGTLSPIHAALDVMRPAGQGAILVTTSSSGLFGDMGYAAYAAAKAALLGLVPSLAAEVRKAGIRVNSILPFAHTQMTEWLFEAGHMPREAAERLSPDLVADLAVWLVSRDCPLSGETLIAGGRVFARAEVRTSRGLELDAEAVSPEALADRYPEIADMRQAESHSLGGAMLESIIARTLGRESD